MSVLRIKCCKDRRKIKDNVRPKIIMKNIQSAQFPYKRISVLGALCGILIPVIIVSVNAILYGGISSIALISNIYFLIFSNLILISIYTYTAKYVYENIGNRRVELGVSGLSAFVTMIVLNWLFLKNAFLRNTSSTDVFIIIIIPFWGLFSSFAGYFVTRFFTCGKNEPTDNKA